MFPDFLLERLSDLEHVQWMNWSKDIADKENISQETKDRWSKYWVDYYNLDESIKDYDREYAFKILQSLDSYFDKYTSPKVPYFSPLITTPTVKPRVDRLVFPMIYRLNKTKYIYIPQGLETDYASVPRPLWVLLPPRGNWSECAVLHDYLYKFNGEIFYYQKYNGSVLIKGEKVFLSKEKCDKLFYKSLLEIGIIKPLAQVFYRSVLYFGKHAWNNHLREDYEEKWNLIFPEKVYTYWD